MIARAVAALGHGPARRGGGRAARRAALLARARARRSAVDLANHSLGRPLDATADDVAEAVGCWQTRMGDAWDAVAAEIDAYRSRLARLLGAPRADCVVPKTSAGQGLRAILNSYDTPPRVVATRGEFDSIDVILREYARRGRIALSFVEPREHGLFAAEDLLGGGRARRRSRRRVAGRVQHRAGPAGAARARRRHARARRARAARRLSLARRVPGRRDGARRRLRDRRQLQVSARRARARAISICIRGISTARSRRSTSAGSPSASHLPTSGPTRRGSRRAATRSSNRRRRSCRGTRRAPDRSSRSRSASRGCARIRSRCSSGWSRCSPSAGSRPRRQRGPRRVRRRSAIAMRPRSRRRSSARGVSRRRARRVPASVPGPADDERRAR